MPEKVAVVYFSQTGNTEKVARAIACGLEQAGTSPELLRLEKTDPTTLRNYDLFGLGSPVFYYKLPFNVTWFIRRMHACQGKYAFGFLTEGGHVANTFLRMQKDLAKRGVTLVDTFKCFGFDTFPPYIGTDRQLGHPDESELAAAEAFGRGLIERRDRIRAAPMVSGSLLPTFDKETGPFERLSVLLTRPVLFCVFPRKRVNRSECTKCGVCVESCPTRNIRLAPWPKFSWRCVYCYYCERVCPEGAIECDWTAVKRRMEKRFGRQEQGPGERVNR